MQHNLNYSRLITNNRYKQKEGIGYCQIRTVTLAVMINTKTRFSVLFRAGFYSAVSQQRRVYITYTIRDFFGLYYINT